MYKIDMRGGTFVQKSFSRTDPDFLFLSINANLFIFKITKIVKENDILPWPLFIFLTTDNSKSVIVSSNIIIVKFELKTKL